MTDTNTLRAFFESEYPGKSVIFENLIKPIFDKAKDATLTDTQLPLDSEKKQIKSFSIIAQVRGAFPITFADVELQDSVALKRSRVQIQNCVRRLMNDNTNAIIFFHFADSKKEWRVSYAHRGETLSESTSAKRYTYLCGIAQHCRTVAERFAKLSEHTRIDDEKLLEAFSVEALSDDFFKEYKVFYEDFVQFITGNRYVKREEGNKTKWVKVKIHEPNKSVFPQFLRLAREYADSRDEESVTALAQKYARDYIKKLMGRLVFLQFLQKKGWLGVPKNEPYGNGDHYYLQNLFAQSKHQDDFLNKVLEVLFFDTLNCVRNDDAADSILGKDIKIPYLNGGLFENDGLFDKTKIKFPKAFFANPEYAEKERVFMGERTEYPYSESCGLFDFFARYNFTIDETDPIEQEVGIEPEMLGKIFENLLEDNKDKGAFYTPKNIVQYMCRESLVSYLNGKLKTENGELKIRNFVISHDVSSFSDSEKNTLLHALHIVKVCDPAVGSGAFPMGMLNELFACRVALGDNGHSELVSESQTLKQVQGDNSAAEIKKNIVRNNIYGVDIEKGAIDIARLRF